MQEHIAQLDLEHSAVSQITPNMSEVDPDAELKGKSEGDLCVDVQALVDKILYLRGQLVLASQRAEKPIDIQGLCFFKIQHTVLLQTEVLLMFDTLLFG